jgi:mannitol-1-phosphate/altronate dehydrogenase
VAALAERLIRQEVAPALLADNAEMNEAVAAFAQTFLERCKTSFKDPCARVARDPLRKLQRNERILSSIDLASKHAIDTPALAYGAALAIHYALRAKSSKGSECQMVQRLYEDSGSVEAVLTHTGSYNGKPYPGMDPVGDAGLIETISGHFERLREVDSEHWGWPLQAVG